MRQGGRLNVRLAQPWRCVGGLGRVELMIDAGAFRALAGRLRGAWSEVARDRLFANGAVASPAIAGITGERLAWTASITSELSIPCR